MTRQITRLAKRRTQLASWHIVVNRPELTFTVKACPERRILLASSARVG